MPRLARTGISTPSSTKVCWPISGAVHGVDGREDGVDLREQLEHALAIPAAEFLRLVDQRRRHHGASDQAVAHRRIEVVRARAQPVEVERRALGRGDDIGRGARARGLGDFDLALGTERRGDAIERGARFGKRALAEIAAGDRDAQPSRPRSSSRRDGSAGRSIHSRIVRIKPCIAS